MAEWLRRLTRNQIPSGSVGSSPTDCGSQIFEQKDYLNYDLQLEVSSKIHSYELRLPQWRNWLAHGTYKTVVVSNAGVVSSSLTWGNFYTVTYPE